jgi:lincosamide nucleotidyltransferase B/F
MSPLLKRLQDIGESLQASQHALALIGLGSVARLSLDAYSDLDFFAVVEDGYKEHYIQNLDWLTGISPVAYVFQNTPDGHKLLYADGIFCEFAVFEMGELQSIPFSAGRVVWKKPEVQDCIAFPRTPTPSKLDPQWQLGEALTNLLIGLKRFRRGEKLSGSRFVQSYALEHILELVQLIEPEQPYPKDPFSHDRRLEQRFPKFAELLPSFVQGYQNTPQSALAMLEFLEQHFTINTAIAQEIRKELLE